MNRQDPLANYLDVTGAYQRQFDPMNDWIGGPAPHLVPPGRSRSIGDPNIKNFVSFNYGGDQVSGADLDELAELDSAIKLLLTECDSQAPAMFPGVSGQDYVGWSWPWESDETATVAKKGVSCAVPGTTPEYQAFKKFRAELGEFYSSEWNPWYQKNSGVLSSLGAEAEAKLEAYKQRFNQLRAKAISHGIKTDTHEIANQVRDGSKTGWDKFWDSIPWRYVVPVAGVVLLPFYLPVLSGFAYSVIKIRKGGVKSLAT